MSDILLIDKPREITSFDVIRQLRKKLGVKKMGHAGTLDPLASGLMIIGIGNGTKKLNQYIKLPKVYQAEILLGIKTTTGDLEGEVTEKKEVSEIAEATMKKVLGSMVGKISLSVPLYSAVKISGKPLYQYARRHVEIEPPSKEMEVFWITLKKIEGPMIKIELEVASGTYVRSIAEEIGRRLRYPATLFALRRTKIGDFRVEDAESLAPKY